MPHKHGKQPGVTSAQAHVAESVLLGAGGGGHVVLAAAERLRDPFALKQVTCADPSLRAELERQLDAEATVQTVVGGHPGIVQARLCCLCCS